MPAGEPSPPASDLAVGMEFYLSQSPGVPGQLKAIPEEFLVRELSSYPRPEPDGAFTILRLESRGWEQHELAEAVAGQLGLPRTGLSWAGTKDRRAVAERLFSYRGAPPAATLELAGVRLLEAYRAREGLVLGRHYGNAFDVRVRVPSDPSEAVASFRRVVEELGAAGGFPNFFGGQRFGEVRPITHVVGRWLARGDLPAAVDAYLVDRPAAGSEGVGDAARAAYAEHRDAARALREFPHEYRFEQSMLQRLARGESAERAFRALPFALRRLFVHAYQSYLFNRYLSARHAAGLPLGRPVAGDVVLRVGRDGTMRGDDSAEVREENLEECFELVRAGRGAVAGPLVGLETRWPPGPPSELFAKILASEAVTPAAFGVPVAPELASEGTWRPLLVPLPPIALEPDADGVWFRFALPKGSYATVLLREFLKGALSAAAEPTFRAEATNTRVRGPRAEP